MFNVRKVIQMLNQFLELVQSAADKSRLLELIVFVTTKESNLHLKGGWILLNVLNESPINSSITFYADLFEFVTSLQHILNTWVLIKLCRVLTQFQLPNQDFVLEETESFDFVISNSKFLVLLKMFQVIFFDLENWLRFGKMVQNNFVQFLKS